MKPAKSKGNAKRLDLTGQLFGKLTALYPTYQNGHREWMCQCSCGNKRIALTATLKRGRVKSCGCLFKNLQKLSGEESGFRRLFGGYKTKAKQRHLSFELTINEFRQLTEQNCFYCGIKPLQISKSFRTYQNGFYLYNGIDRIENDKGYTLANSVPCCGRCNEMKMGSNYQEFLRHIEMIAINMKLGQGVKI